MDERRDSETNLLFEYVMALSYDLECGSEDGEMHLHELLAGRSSLQDRGFPDSQLQHICDAYEQDEDYQAGWQDFQPLRALYRLYPDEAFVQELWRHALRQSACFDNTLDEAEELQLIEAIQDFHRRHQDDAEWQDQYYEMIKDMVNTQEREKVLLPLLEIWGTLPEDQEAYAEAQRELLEEFWTIALYNSENPAVIAALDAILQPWLQDEKVMKSMEAECLKALVSISEYQAAADLERNLLFIRNYADAYPSHYVKLLCYTISARYARSQDLEKALAELQELKDLAAASRKEAEGDEWAEFASPVMECFYRMLAALADSQVEAFHSVLHAAETYLIEIGFADHFELSARDEPSDEEEGAYPARMRTVHDRDLDYGEVPGHYCRMLFELLSKEVQPLRAYVLQRLRYLQQQHNGIFMACLNRYLIRLNYAQLMCMAKEFFADFPAQEQLMHAVAYEMADEPLYGDLSLREAEECLLFMRECLQRFPKQYSFLFGFSNAVQCIVKHRLQQGDLLDDLLQEMREWLEAKLAMPVFELYERQEMLEHYVDLYKSIAMMQCGEDALHTLYAVDTYRRNRQDVPMYVFEGEQELDLMWEDIRRKHPDPAVREAATQFREPGQNEPGAE